MRNGGSVRAVIDTNVLIAALFWHGPPRMLVAQARGGTLTLVSSPALLAELADVLGRPKFDAVLSRSETTREQVMAAVRQVVEMVDPPPLPQPVCRDADDDALLALALAAQADWIVSGDRDLLVLEKFQGIPILDPAQAVRLMEVPKLP